MFHLLGRLLAILVIFMLGIFTEHNFKVIQHLQNQCPHMQVKDGCCENGCHVASAVRCDECGNLCVCGVVCPCNGEAE